MKILMIDIETTPALVYVWRLFGQDISVDQIVEPTALLCFSWRWYGENKTHFVGALQEDRVKYNAMVQKAHDLLSEADAVCHFNGMSFDIPRLNQEFLQLKMSPPPAIPNIDLKKVVMSKFDMTSSKLAFVGPYLKIGAKVKHEGWPLWRDCLAGDAGAWAKMEKYNRQDVVLLERLYERVLPWIDNHPNYGLLELSDKPLCPNCGSGDMHKRGVQRATTNVYVRYQCQDCGRWSRARKANKGQTPIVR